MLRGTRHFLKVSPVAIRPVITSLDYERKYNIRKKLELAHKYNTVTEQNRYESLRLLLSKLSGYVGRRPYKMQSDLASKYMDHFRALGVDWHELKLMSREQLLEVLEHVKMTHADRVLLLTVLNIRVCGVLTRGEHLRDPGQLCMRRGKAEHGWRCGVAGHRADVYFERKAAKLGSDLSLLHGRSAVIKNVETNGVVREVRPEPDFAVVGRLRHDDQPRVWSTPQSPLFDVMLMGYEFRVHPRDPRAKPQIADAEREWAMHADILRTVIWEMLELYAVERKPQKLELTPWEMGEPDVPEQYSSCFTTRDTAIKQKNGSGPAAKDDDRPITEQEVVVEQRMMGTSSGSSEVNDQPWFLPPLEQEFTTDGIPTILPFAPSIIIRSSFRQVQRDTHFAQSLVTPVCDIRCYLHPEASFWWQRGGSEEQKALENIVNWAKRIPYPLPFNLYFRVDAAKNIRADEQFVARRESLLASKRESFDLSRYVEFWSAKDPNKKEGDDADDARNEGQHEPADHNTNDDPEPMPVETIERSDAESPDEADGLNPPGWR